MSSKELRDGSLRIEFDILAPTMGSKKIVVGTQGAAIGVVGRCVDKASAPVIGAQGAPAARPRSAAPCMPSPVAAGQRGWSSSACGSAGYTCFST